MRGSGSVQAEGARDGQQAFHRGQVGAALDGADLADAQARRRGQVLERPVPFGAQDPDALAELVAQPVLQGAPQPVAFDRVGQRLPQLVQRERLGQIVEHVLLERCPHVFERRVAGDDDHAKVRVQRQQPLEHLVAARAAHLHVQQHDVGPLPGGRLQQLGGALEDAHRVDAFVPEEILDVLQKIAVVVEHGDVDEPLFGLQFGRHGCGRPARAGRITSSAAPPSFLLYARISPPF